MDFAIGQLCINDNRYKKLYLSYDDLLRITYTQDDLVPWQPFMVLEAKEMLSEHGHYCRLKILVDEKIRWIEWNYARRIT